MQVAALHLLIYFPSFYLQQNSRSTISISEEDDEEEVIERITKQAEDVQAKLSKYRQRRKEIKDELRNLTKTIKKLEVGLPKLSLEISGCDTTREELTRLIPELRTQCEVSDEEAQKVEELQAKVEQCKAFFPPKSDTKDDEHGRKLLRH